MAEIKSIEVVFTARGLTERVGAFVKFVLIGLCLAVLGRIAASLRSDKGISITVIYVPVDGKDGGK